MAAKNAVISRRTPAPVEAPKTPKTVRPHGSRRGSRSPLREQHTQRAALEEVRQACRGVEEVECVARRRGVEHDRVKGATAVELVELGDGAELL